MQSRLILVLLLGTVTAVIMGNSHTPVRLNSVVVEAETRSTTIVGFGLVVGLDGTGSKSVFTQQLVEDLLQRQGITSRPAIADSVLQTSNISAVMVVANLDPIARLGSRLDVTVSAIDDANSLIGGTLLLTPLKGPDGEVYAVAQGCISITSYVDSKQGRIRRRAIVEKKVAEAIDPKLSKSDEQRSANAQ